MRCGTRKGLRSILAPPAVRTIRPVLRGAARTNIAAAEAKQMTGLVRLDADRHVNPTFVTFIEWDRRHYMNGPGSSALVITMADGTVHRVRHEPHLLGGTDGYEVERAIIEGIEAATASQ
jgi:hypothetical protein